MRNSFLLFDLRTYLRKPSFYFILLSVFLLGFFVGNKFSLSPSSEVFKNSPYAITNMIGLLSLLGIFITTIFGAQLLLKESTSSFNTILYALPLQKGEYLFGRFLSVLILSLSCATFLIVGYYFGQLNDHDLLRYNSFKAWNYLQPFLLIVVPNITFCTSLICAVAWVFKSKFSIYLTGLFLYMLYMILLVYSGSPMMAGSLPQSAQMMDFAAKADPFSLSAFYQQTNLWSVDQKNLNLTSLQGNMLFNRLIYLGFSCFLILIPFLVFSFKINDERFLRKNKGIIKSNAQKHKYLPVIQIFDGFNYQFDIWLSLLKINLKMVLKSIPFILISTGVIFFISMEFYGAIDKGIRLPEAYASTALLVNRIIYNLPGALLLILLFYAQELFWLSSDSKFNVIENALPSRKIIPFLAKWMVLNVVLIILTTIIVITALAFQLIYKYNHFDWQIYIQLFWLIDVPLITASGLILIVHYLSNNKWIGLLISFILMVILFTSLGKSLGINHPLIRFTAAYAGKYSELNGWDDYLRTFSWRMFFNISFTSLIIYSILNFRALLHKKFVSPIFFVALILSVFIGLYIFKETPLNKKELALEKQEKYERLYRKYSSLPQPKVIDIKTKIDLFPEKNSYKVKGEYLIQNKTKNPIKQLLITLNEYVKFENSVLIQEGLQTKGILKSGFLKLKQPLLPGDFAQFHFSFSYQWDGFKGHEDFNAIVNNGSFLRISNYFPRFGYQSDEEISNIKERRLRNLGEQTPLLKLESKRGDSNFINLAMIVSTPQSQKVIGVGELTDSLFINGRNYYQYKSIQPIPFRFGFSSANYQVKKDNFRDINIEIFFDKKHHENVDELISNIKLTLDYCERNFRKYPFKTIRFAEVSLFTNGFAGTAYPSTIFMTEDMIFHANMKVNGKSDVINELASHELSHQWWGNNQLAPDEREGSKLLTETLAMYTELMVLKHKMGMQYVLEKVKMHREIYNNNKGFEKEESLLKGKPENFNLFYSKGLVVMYELSQLIGEQNINKALRGLLEKHAYPKPAPIATDLLEELYLVSPKWQHEKIKSIFNDIN